ncbi:MAG: tetratricopeptide repeat protein [Gammaproteobacteria bacterium]
MPNANHKTLVVLSLATVLAAGGDAAQARGALPGHCTGAPGVGAVDTAPLLPVPRKTEVRPFPTTGQGPGDPRYLESSPPLFQDLGSLHYPVTTGDPRAQRYFDQGLRLTYAFNHPEARRAFREAARLDPGCALCYWGEALVLGPNINAPMEADALLPALAALNKARARAPRASEREQALISALGARYSDDPGAGRAALDAAYAEAMGKVAVRFPRDLDIQVLYAEAAMDLSPWDHWEAGGGRPKGQTAEILATLERVLEAKPDHPGAIHYYIHLVEASDRPGRAAPYADRLGALMPGAGHLVHMPFHIYFRSGRYLEALRVNEAAVEADERYLQAASPTGIYAMAYFPHNVHSLLVSAQMAGDGKRAIAAAEKLTRLVTDEASRTVPWVQPIAAAPYFAHARFSTPETVLTMPGPHGGLPFVAALWHYARGVAHAARRDLEAAVREAEAIGGIAIEADFSALTAAGIPAIDVLTVARHVLEGRIAQARGDLAAARTAFDEAVAVQDRLAYAEPPNWYYPVRQSLGAVLLATGDLDGAEAAFRASLRDAPNNGWALHGLAEVYRRQGRPQAEAEVRGRLAGTWAGSPPDLARL